MKKNKLQLGKLELTDMLEPDEIEKFKSVREKINPLDELKISQIFEDYDENRDL